MTAEYYGFNPPFIGGAENIMSRQEDDRLIKNDILQLLLTVPGERVMRPDFGVNLRNFVFEQLTPNDLASLRVELREQITTQEPRVIVESVELERDDDNNQLRLKIVAQIKKDPKRQLTIEQFIDLATESEIRDFPDPSRSLV
jgi:phage baseplate assembly protein W